MHQDSEHMPTYEQDTAQEDFARMLESSIEQSLENELQVGDRVSATIISIGEKNIFLDTGTPKDGVADREEFLDENGQPDIAEGDTVDLFVVKITADAVFLSKAVSGVGGLHMLQEAFEKELPVEGLVTGTCKGGFNVEILKRRAFCPVSQMDSRYVDNTEEFVGQTHVFRIIKFEEKGRNLVLSRRVLLEEEQRESRESFFSAHTSGDVITGQVTRIMPYGAFVEIAPGLEGMVHVSELSWSRVDDPAQAVKVGEKIEVRILSVDTDSKSGQPRISLSAKQAQPDPWTQLEGRLETGQKITGTIVRHAPFGVFVEILPGVEGLVHISEMSYVRRVVDPTQEVKINDRVPVLVKAIDPDNRRISLSMKDAEGDPWLGVEERFKVGAVIRGTVEKREKFGIFVTLMPGVTGLLPGSRIAKSGKAKEIEALKPQDPIDVKIMEIDLQNRRIGLGPNEEGEMQKQDWQRFAPTKQQSSMGNLGQKLRQAMQAKDKKK